MSEARRSLLRANALFLVLAGAGGLRSDILGIFFGQGPVGRSVAAAPHAGIGFVEAHGLAVILGVLLWRAAPERSWHLAAAAIHVLLGTANLVFWPFFLAADMLAMGYITTSLHWFFVALQLLAAALSRAASSTAAAIRA